MVAEAEAGVTKLHNQFPVTSSWELKLENGEVVKGQIYCTDPVANIVVLQDPVLNEIRMVSVVSIQESKQVKEASAKDMEPVHADMSHTKKVLEEREKRAIKKAQESLRHLNPKVRQSNSSTSKPKTDC